MVDTGASAGLLIGRKDLKRRDLIHLRKNRNDLLAFVPFAILIALPGTFILMPLAFRFAPFLIPSVFRTKAMAEMIDGKPERKVEILNAVPGDIQSALDRSLASLIKANRSKLASLEEDLAAAIRQSTRGGTTYEALLRAKDVGVFLHLSSFTPEQLKGYAYFMGIPGFFPSRALQRRLTAIQQDDKVPLLSYFFFLLFFSFFHVFAS